MDNDSKFDYVEYAAFISMLLLSIIIGFYFGCIKGGQNTVTGYLLGSKRMTVFPVVMSLVSTNISGITLLGLPTEVYMFGTQFVMSIVPALVASVINVIAILPVFYKLQLISLYEYMELRFNNATRRIISFLFIFSWLTYVPTVIYGPGLALNQVSGMNVHIVTPIISIICIVYTTLGGLKAVVWSDTLQGSVMIGSVLIVMILGIRDVGGITNVIKYALEGERLEFFNMDPNPNTRLSFWSASIGTFCTMLLSFSCSPTAVQRYNSLPTFREARSSALGLAIGGCVFVVLSGLTGLIIYARYKDCNPIASKMISRPDQILPLYVIEIATNVKGLSGLFMAGIVCAALSTMSTGLNTLSGTIYEDFIEPLLPNKPTERKASLILKFLVIVIGIVAVLLVAIIEKLGQLVEIAQGFGGMTSGTMQGIFLLGLFFPFANTTGALSGGLVSLITMIWLMAGNILANSKGLIRHATKPMSTEMCANATDIIPTQVPADTMMMDFFPFYKVTVFYYSIIGCIIVLLIGIPVSLLTGGNKHKQLDLNLISPIITPFCDVKKKHRYSSVQTKTELL